MARTISTDYSTGVILNPGDSPVYIEVGITVANSSGTGLQSNLSTYTSINNSGSVQGTGTTSVTGDGIALAAGGALTNAGGGQIAGYDFGVSIAGSGTVVNEGSISAAQTSGNSASYIGHQLIALSAGLYIAGGGVYNAQNAIVTGPLAGVGIGAGGSVANAGTISSGTATSAGFGVILGSGGSVTNLSGGLIKGGHYAVADVGQFTLDNQTNATITSLFLGILGTYQAGTVTNQGTIAGYSVAGINLRAGGAVTNLTGGSIIGGRAGIYIRTLPGTLVNDGYIRDGYRAPSGQQYYQKPVYLGGVSFTAGGVVTNSGDGRIVGNSYGLRISGGTGTLSNGGTISSYRYMGGAAVDLLSGGSVTNSLGGLFAGEWVGLQLGQFNPSTATSAQGPLGTMTVVNQGSIVAADGAGDGAAVWMYGPGTVINDPTGVIEGATNGTVVGDGGWNGVREGGFGIVAYYQTTVINYGSIGGGTYNSGAYNGGSTVGPKAFAFVADSRIAANTISNLIEIAPGSSFGGVVKGTDGSASATLELLSGASAGTVVSFGTVTVAAIYHGYLGFGAVKIDDGARWTLNGTVASGTAVDFDAGGTGALTFASPSAIQGTITGFGVNETVALAGITDATGVSLSATGNVLTVEGTGITLQFNPAASYAGETFSYQVVGNETDVTVSCFAAGTSIQTEHGPVPVEHLKPGTRVITHRGDPAEVVWLGHRAIDCRRHPNPAAVCPVRVRADAFGPGMPSRDLLLSPDHAVFIRGMLIPIHCLINGGTICQETVPEVTYYHVELAGHDIILAEDLPVESYLDTGDRANFGNGGGPLRLFPDFSARMWEMAGCAPLVMTGPALELVCQALARNEPVVAGRGLARGTTRVTNRYTYY